MKNHAQLKQMLVLIVSLFFLWLICGTYYLIFGWGVSFFTPHHQSGAAIAATMTQEVLQQTAIGTPVPMPTAVLPPTVAPAYGLASESLQPTAVITPQPVGMVEAESQTLAGPTDAFQKIFAIVPFLIPCLLVFILAGTEIRDRYQLGELAMTITMGTLSVIGIFTEIEPTWFKALITFGPAFAMLCVCVLGKNDFSPLSFYIGGIGILLFLVRNFQISPKQELVLPALLIVAAAFISLYETRREDVLPAANREIMLYSVMQLFGLVLGLLVFKNGLWTMLFVHIAIITFLVVFNTGVTQPILRHSRPMAAVYGQKFNNQTPSDPMSFLNYIVVLIFIAQMILA